jgi:NAD-dependent SIR2 family protein deacetylase
MEKSLVFWGEGGLWSKSDPRCPELEYFHAHPKKAWPLIRGIFYDHFGAPRLNMAHEVRAAWEARRLLITQNIDTLHHIASSKKLCSQDHRKTWSKYARKKLQPRSAHSKTPGFLWYMPGKTERMTPPRRALA